MHEISEYKSTRSHNKNISSVEMKMKEKLFAIRQRRTNIYLSGQLLPIALFSLRSLNSVKNYIILQSLNDVIEYVKYYHHVKNYSMVSFHYIDSATVMRGAATAILFIQDTYNLDFRTFYHSDEET